MKDKIIIIIVILVALLTTIYMFKMMDSGSGSEIQQAVENNDVYTDYRVDKTHINNTEIKNNAEQKLKEYRQNVSSDKLSRLYIVKCAACHGKDGKGIIGLLIIGKSYEYNYEALLKYKNGQVKNSLMKGLLENTPDNELKSLAEEISRFE